jgi:hypothetical protein
VNNNSITIEPNSDVENGEMASRYSSVLGGKQVMKSRGISSIVRALILFSSSAKVPSHAAYTLKPARGRIERTVFRGGPLKVLGQDQASVKFEVFAEKADEPCEFRGFSYLFS